jgi:hypothetical protein
MANPNDAQKQPAKKADAMVIPVTNNLEAIQQIAVRPRRGSGAMVQRAALSLLPGINLVDPEKWAEAAENPHAKTLMETAIPPMPKAPQFSAARVGKPYLVVGSPLPKDNPLGGMTPDEAVTFIGDVADDKALQKMEKVEARDAVRLAIRARRAQISRGGKVAA